MSWSADGHTDDRGRRSPLARRSRRSITSPAVTPGGRSTSARKPGPSRMIGDGNRIPSSTPGLRDLFSSAMPSEPSAVTIRSAVSRGTASESTDREVSGRSADRPTAPSSDEQDQGGGGDRGEGSRHDHRPHQPSRRPAPTRAVTRSRLRTIARCCSVSRTNTAGSAPAVFIAGPHLRGRPGRCPTATRRPAAGPHRTVNGPTAAASTAGAGSRGTRSRASCGAATSEAASANAGHDFTHAGSTGRGAAGGRTGDSSTAASTSASRRGRTSSAWSSSTSASCSARVALAGCPVLVQRHDHRRRLDLDRVDQLRLVPAGRRPGRRRRGRSRRPPIRRRLRGVPGTLGGDPARTRPTGHRRTRTGRRRGATGTPG